MEKFLVYLVVFMAGFVLACGFYAKEIALAKRMLSAWQRGDAFFKKEIASIEAEFKRIFHVA